MVKWLWQNEKCQGANTGLTVMLENTDFYCKFSHVVSRQNSLSQNVMMENNASVKEANMEITVAKMVITNLAAASKTVRVNYCGTVRSILRSAGTGSTHSQHSVPQTKLKEVQT